MTLVALVADLSIVYAQIVNERLQVLEIIANLKDSVSVASWHDEYFIIGTKRSTKIRSGYYYNNNVLDVVEYNIDLNKPFKNQNINADNTTGRLIKTRPSNLDYLEAIKLGNIFLICNPFLKRFYQLAIALLNAYIADLATDSESVARILSILFSANISLSESRVSVLYLEKFKSVYHYFNYSYDRHQRTRGLHSYYKMQPMSLLLVLAGYDTVLMNKSYGYRLLSGPAIQDLD